MEPDDLALLIGVLAICEGQISVGQADEVAEEMLQRWRSQRVLGPDATVRDVRQILADLKQRVRYARGEYTEPPVSTTVGD
jgi:polyhydroxyalkanoate synthesis regulator phasin